MPRTLIIKIIYCLLGVIIIKTFEINSQDFVLVNDLEKGFLRGSIWGNLYDGYKFILENIGSMSEEQRLMLMLQVYAFTSLEISMYITTHPNNSEAIKTLKRVNIEKEKLKETIEKKYGALCSTKPYIDGYYDRKNTWERL